MLKRLHYAYNSTNVVSLTAGCSCKATVSKRQQTSTCLTTQPMLCLQLHTVQFWPLHYNNMLYQRK